MIHSRDAQWEQAETGVSGALFELDPGSSAAKDAVWPILNLLSAARPPGGGRSAGSPGGKSRSALGRGSSRAENCAPFGRAFRGGDRALPQRAMCRGALTPGQGQRGHPDSGNARFPRCLAGAGFRNRWAVRMRLPDGARTRREWPLFNGVRSRKPPSSRRWGTGTAHWKLWSVPFPWALSGLAGP